MKYNSRDAEVEPRTDEPEYGVINFRRVALDKKGDMVGMKNDETFEQRLESNEITKGMKSAIDEFIKAGGIEAEHDCHNTASGEGHCNHSSHQMV